MIAVIIQARISSTRLPEKILLKACGKTMLEHMIERVKRSKKINEIVVATTNRSKDDIIENLCNEMKIKCFRGPENDVLLRYKLASESIGADIVVRITSDNPLMDPQIIDQVIEIFQKNNYDLVSNSSFKSTTYPHGFTVEVFSSKTLEEVDKEAQKPSDREHVILFMSLQPKKYKFFQMHYERDLSKYRLTLDYPEDYSVIKSVFEGLYPQNPYFTMEDAILWLDKHPKIFSINSHIKPNQNILKSFEFDKKAGF